MSTGNSEMRPYVSVVLPAYNEEASIAQVIADVKSAMGTTNYTYEIIVVDDKSTDRTREVVSTIPGVSLLQRKTRGGSGASRKTGIIHAKGEIIVMLDADGSYAPEDIPKLLALMPEYDQVNGWRMSEEGSIRVLRIPAKWLLGKVGSLLAGQKIPDLNTGIKAFKRVEVLPYLWAISDGFSCVSSITLAFMVNGLSVAYIPVTYRKRIGKSKFHPVKDTYNYFETILRTILYFYPLRIFLPVSLFLGFSGFCLGVYNLSRDGHLRPGEVIMWLTGLLIFAIGLLADLIVSQRRQQMYDSGTDNQGSSPSGV